MVSARIPELKDCGCGIPLAVGAKLISIFFCLLNAAGFVIALFLIIKYEIDERNPTESEGQVRTDTWKEVIASMVMVICTFEGALAFCLWYGIKEHNPSFVLPWAILTTAFMVIFSFFELLLLLHYKLSVSTVLFAIGIVIMFYFILIVYSHFRELRREENPPQTLNDGEAA